MVVIEIENLENNPDYAPVACRKLGNVKYACYSWSRWRLNPLRSDQIKSKARGFLE